LFIARQHKLARRLFVCLNKKTLSLKKVFGVLASTKGEDTIHMLVCGYESLHVLLFYVSARLFY